MKLGIFLRNVGPGATRECLLECARGAEEMGLDELWVFDHLAIPPEESEGSDGHYVEPLATLAWVAGATSRIGLGTGVLVLPYRPALLTARWVGAIQHLSGERLTLGVGVGWMEAEFRALGVPRSRRGRLTDETLEVIHRCFAADEVELNGQRFLFRPRPGRPPILVGGSGEHSLCRVVESADGWFPAGKEPAFIAERVPGLREACLRAGRVEPEVALLSKLPLDDPPQAAELLAAYAEAGVTRFALNQPYASPREFRAAVDVYLEAARR